ncbi:CHAT domain-containing protein [Crassisporium funariophilum]|nr:CHAT domain-containing protein [Crassisporium funariophilum]
MFFAIGVTPANQTNPQELHKIGLSFVDRFKRSGDLSDISNAISAFKEEINIIPESHTDMPLKLTNLVTSILCRFECKHDLTDISEVISFLKRAVRLTNVPALLGLLGTSFKARFECTGDPNDISGAISNHQKAVDLLPKGHTSMPGELNNLGDSFICRFKCTGDPTNIVQAISAHQKAFDLTPDGHADIPRRLSSLGNSFLCCFQHTGDLADLSKAISAQQKAIKIAPETHVHMPALLNNLGIVLLSRFECREDLSDLAQAISAHRKAICLTHETHNDMSGRLNNLGNSLLRRFGRTGDLADLSEAISAQQKAIHLTQQGHVNMPGQLNNLGVSFCSRFERTGDLPDISKAILVQQRAVKLALKDHASLPIYLGNLGTSLKSRYERTGDLADIYEAISSHQNSINLTPKGHADLPSRLTCLGNSLLHLFESTGEQADISKAISAHRQAVLLTPENHALMPALLSNLGSSLTRCFEHTGDIATISEAISAQQIAVHATPDEHVEMPMWLNGLGISYRCRFERTGDITDISEAISALQEAVRLTPNGHADMPVWLTNLGSFYIRRFEKSKQDLTSILQAISALQKAVHLAPEAHAKMPLWLNNLGVSLFYRFELDGAEDLGKLHEAVSALQNAVRLSPESHASIPMLLNNLGIFFRHRFKCTGDLVDISEAISAQQNAVRLTPDGHASMPGWLNNLGDTFQARSVHMRDPTDMHSAISNYRLAATYSSGPPSERLKGAQKWAEYSKLFNPLQSMKAYSVAIQLVSLVAGLEQTIQKRHTNLIDISKLSTAAAATAFSFGKHKTALEWLEQGHCLVWNQLNNLRNPVEELQAHDSRLVDEFLKVSRALENLGSRGESRKLTTDASMTQKMSLQEEVNSHVKLAQKWDQLLSKIRTIPTKRNIFTKHYSIKAAKAQRIGNMILALQSHLPKAGPVIVINIHEERCDALALLSGNDTPFHISLEGFSYEKADELRNRLRCYLGSHGVRMREVEHRGMRPVASSKGGSILHEVLWELWVRVVEPILNRLDLFVSRTLDPSRIWWCATGPLAFLPLHSAGNYDFRKDKPMIAVSDSTISSYTPTVTALIERVKGARSVAPEKSKNGLLMICQASTPNLPPLPGVQMEVGAIRKLLTRDGIPFRCLQESEATSDQVMADIELYSFVHFACHAIQDIVEPLRSGFYLHNGRLELIEILKKRLPNADFAFLSACQTSTGDEKLSEEAVHLAAGMLAAGYQGVVATMWSIKDQYGADFAEDFYSDLLRQRQSEEVEELSNAGAAYALHYATKCAFRRLGISESSLLACVPYVHVGI